MGLNVGVNALTSGGLSLCVVLLVVTGILLVSASQKVTRMDDFDSSSNLQKSYNNLRTAYGLMFIAAAITLILAVAYGGHETAWCPSEWIHGVIYVLLVAAVIIGVIYAYIALNDIYDSEIHNTNGSTSFIWAALIIGVLTFMLVIATASGRVGYNVARGGTNHRVRHAEAKIHEMHSHVTGQPNDYVPPIDHCCEPEKPPCGSVPAGMIMMPVGPQLEAPHQVIHTTGYQNMGYQSVGQQPVINQAPAVTVRTVPVQSSTTLPAVPRPSYDSQVIGSQMAQHQFVGSPTVTRHSVITTSQPVVTSSTLSNGYSEVSNTSLRRVPDYL